MRFSVGDVTVDIIVDDDDFELSLSTFLPGSDERSLAERRSLLEPDFLDLGRDVVKFAVQTFALRADGRTIVIDTCIGQNKNRPEIRDSGSTPQHRFPRTAGDSPASSVPTSILCSALTCMSTMSDGIRKPRTAADLSLFRTPAIFSAAVSLPIEVAVHRMHVSSTRQEPSV